MFELRRSTNQLFAADTNHAALKDFCEGILKAGLDESRYEIARIPDMATFQSALAALFESARERLSSLEGIKGVYVEYFYDGGDSCTANIYLCTEYSDDDDFWGAEYTEQGYFVGPSVTDFLDFDPEFEWDDLSRYVAEEYANSMLLAACLEEWEKSEIRNLPFGFAQHDASIVRAPAN